MYTSQKNHILKDNEIILTLTGENEIVEKAIEVILKELKGGLMKLVLFSVLLLSSVTSYAYDTSLNPDHAISVGVTYHSETVSGGYGPKLGGDTYLNLGENEYEKTTVTGDLILPVTNRLSLNLSLSAIELEETFTSNSPSLALSDVSDMDGGAFSIGLRYYFIK